MTLDFLLKKEGRRFLAFFDLCDFDQYHNFNPGAAMPSAIEYIYSPGFVVRVSYITFSHQNLILLLTNFLLASKAPPIQHPDGSIFTFCDIVI